MTDKIFIKNADSPFGFCICYVGSAEDAQAFYNNLQCEKIRITDFTTEKNNVNKVYFSFTLGNPWEQKARKHFLSLIKERLDFLGYKYTEQTVEKS